MDVLRGGPNANANANANADANTNANADADATTHLQHGRAAFAAVPHQQLAVDPHRRKHIAAGTQTSAKRHVFYFVSVALERLAWHERGSVCGRESSNG